MAAPRKFDEASRQRALGMYRDRLDAGDSKLGARKHVGALLDINPATLRNWVDNDVSISSTGDVDSDPDVAGEVARLRRENAELRRANEILKTASAFFAAAEVDRRLR